MLSIIVSHVTSLGRTSTDVSSNILHYNSVTHGQSINRSLVSVLVFIFRILSGVPISAIERSLKITAENEVYASQKLAVHVN